MAKRAKFDVIDAFLERPTRETLESLITSGVGETNTLEFKEAWIAYPKLARHVLAIGNSGGGVIILGVREDEGGTFVPVGLDAIRDPAVVGKGLAKYIPAGVEYELIPFPPRDPAADGAAGRPFQVMFIESDVRKLPLLAKATSTDLEADAVYVRRGTSSVRASHGELERLINARIESGYSSTSVLELEQHLEQLKTLYQAIPAKHHKSALSSALQVFALSISGSVDSEPNPLYPEESIEEFIAGLIPRKKRKIERVLELGE